MSNVRVRLLDEAIALFGADGVRYRADGDELERCGITYLIGLSPAGWRIVFTAVHRPEVVLVE
jgi:hypothetical protein